MPEDEKTVTRIAMWSGPRNISTAMMRSWENRVDTTVVDEPFYACFLVRSGIPHPMHEEVLASQKHDWSEVISGVLSAPLQKHEKIQYQKQMTHHMVGELDLQWFRSLRHAFLIRHPGEVLHSYIEKRERVTASDLGYKRQRELYDLACLSHESYVPIIDAKDVLMQPKLILQQLTRALGVSFDSNMLRWPAGKRTTDGAWASHWYNRVYETSGFYAWKEKSYRLSKQQSRVVDECMPHYEYLHKRRLKPEHDAL